MNKAALGAKRKCLECGTGFFDLLRDPIVCPRCKATFVPPAPPPSAVVYKRKSPLAFRPTGAETPVVPAENDAEADLHDKADLGDDEDDEAVIESDDESDELDEEPDDDTLPLNDDTLPLSKE
ncbi:MAG TPA: FYDLN acid domain-containing protein [Beijerinckiaceae bacterium]|jgi:hypothetical protein|nr:FYDLN acid domain-containing protein [Beijerinckiaceae bacterium]